jgi:hypothetical protein
MAGVLAHVNSGEFALVGATPKTGLQIKAAAQQRAIVSSIRLMGKQPAGGTDTPVKVRLTRSTANFGTGSVCTPGKNDPSDSETLQTTVAGNFTVEPTTPTDGGLWWEVQPQAGVIELLMPGQEIKVPGGQALNIELTSAATPTVLVCASYTE